MTMVSCDAAESRQESSRHTCVVSVKRRIEVSKHRISTPCNQPRLSQSQSQLHGAEEDIFGVGWYSEKKL